MVYDRRRYDHLTLEQKVDTALELLDGITDAFPDGVSRHRETHEAWTKAKNAEAAFWVALKLDIAKKGIWGLLVTIFGLILVGFSTRTGVWFR